MTAENRSGSGADHRRRFWLLVVIMTVVGFATPALSIVALYQAAFDAERKRLVDIVTNQARLMESVARFDRRYTDYPAGARSASLLQLIEAHGRQIHQLNPDSSLHLLIGQRSHAGIEMLVDEPDAPADASTLVPWDDEKTTPMRLALSGQTGTIDSVEMKGRHVLAAYAPVPSLQVGLVAHVELRDLRRPFIRATVIAFSAGVLLIGAGVILFVSVGEPMLRRLREQEALYRRLFDNSPNPQYIIDPETTAPIAVNDSLARILGYTREELVKLPIAAYEAKETPGDTAARIARILRCGGDEFETLWRAKSGAILTMLINVRVIDQSGRKELHCVATDMTERIRAEKRIHDLRDQLRSTARANELGQMVSAVTHELKQPLTAALNYANAVRHSAQAGGAPQVADIARRTAEQIERCSEIIAGLRTYIRQGELVRASEDINRIVEEAVALTVGTSNADGVDLRLSLQPDLLPANVNRVQIHQVLVNLLRNAIEATASMARRIVLVETRQTQPCAIEVAVCDSGPGISPEIADRLFQPFVTTKRHGLGIGLAISEAIATAHGGRLWVENLDTGAKFRLTLPTATAISGEP